MNFEVNGLRLTAKAVDISLKLPAVAEVLDASADRIEELTLQVAVLMTAGKNLTPVAYQEFRENIRNVSENPGLISPELFDGICTFEKD